MHTFPMTETPTLDFAETQSITLEWKLSGLKHIYESTRGETKSSVRIFSSSFNLQLVFRKAGGGCFLVDEIVCGMGPI